MVVVVLFVAVVFFVVVVFTAFVVTFVIVVVVVVAIVVAMAVVWAWASSHQQTWPGTARLTFCGLELHAQPVDVHDSVSCLAIREQTI